MAEFFIGVFVGLFLIVVVFSDALKKGEQAIMDEDDDKFINKIIKKLNHDQTKN